MKKGHAQQDVDLQLNTGRHSDIPDIVGTAYKTASEDPTFRFKKTFPEKPLIVYREQ